MRALFTSRARRLGRRVRDDDRGMTLIELMVGIGMGTVVMLASYTAIDAANQMQTRTAMRVESVHRGRDAMENITRAVRAQQCYNGARPMLWASDNAMEFYSSIAPLASTTFQPVERHQIIWIANSASDAPTYLKTTTPTAIGDIWQYVWRLNPATNTWSTTPVRRRLAEDVERAPDRRNGGQLAPFFRYYKYTAATGSGRIDYNDPVDMTATQNGVPSAPGADLAGIVLVEMSFKVTPRRTASAKSASMNFYNTVSVRIADPTNPGGSPQCL